MEAGTPVDAEKAATERRPIGALAAIAAAMTAAIAAVAVGVAVSRGAGDWAWFARSESVLVAVGVAFAYFNVDNWMERGIGEGASRLRQRLQGNGATPRFLRDFVVSIDERANFRPIPNTVKLFEVLLVIVGTLIWGFGDLLNLVPLPAVPGR